MKALFTYDRSAPPRPSDHNPITAQYAIDQVTDPEQLREMAHVLYEAFHASRKQMDHLLSVHATGNEECEPCVQAYTHCDPAYACDGYKERHKLVMRGLGLI